MKNKYYAIQGSSTIISNWSYCKKYVKGKNVKYRGFTELSDALIYLKCSKYKIISNASSNKELIDNPYFKSVTPITHIFASSLEKEVGDYLDSIHVKYVTQDETLVCINPTTHTRLPYDFELPSYKIILEVQGQQHYETGKDFNKSESELLYQKYKDCVKKEFAISKGYTFIALSYDDIQQGNYKRILNKYFSL